MAISSSKKRLLSGIAIGVLISIFLGILAILNIGTSWHNKIADTLYTNDNPSDEIVIIAIDEKSARPPHDGLGKFSQWSRENYVQLLENIGKESRVIAFDVIFDKPTQQISIEKLKELELDEISVIKNPIDIAFANKLAEYNNIVLAYSDLEPLRQFAQYTEIGTVSASLDSDGIMRTVNPQGDFADAVLKQYYNRDIELPDEMLVNYFGEPFSYNMVSFVDVFDGKIDSATFQDKIVLIGVTHTPELQDTVPTPTSTEPEMPGVEFRANEIQTILQEKFIENQSTAGQIITIAVIALALAIAIMYLGAILSTIITVAAVVLYYLAGHLLFGWGLILNMLYPFLAIALTFLASWVYKYFIADRSKREMKSAFGHYVSDKLVEEISKNPDLVKLGGEKKQITVFFSDIKDSTALSEQIPTEKWVAQMNEYFTVMESVIKQLGGTIDKYEGDAIMGFWGAPIKDTDHVAKAHTAALEMKKALAQLNTKWKQESKVPLEFRIGLNTGETIVGNFGSKDRFDYTAMGDTVNVASRLESSANKTYGTTILASGFHKSSVLSRELDTVLLPGKKEPVKIYELLEKGNEDLCFNYAQALSAYKNKDFKTAVLLFAKLLPDPPSFVLHGRAKLLAEGKKVANLDDQMVYRIVNK